MKLKAIFGKFNCKYKKYGSKVSLVTFCEFLLINLEDTHICIEFARQNLLIQKCYIYLPNSNRKIILPRLIECGTNGPENFCKQLG